MGAPNPSPSTNQVYNDGNFGFGGFTVTIYGPPQPNGAQRGIYIMESFVPNRNTKSVDRPDEIGGPNGFNVVNAQNTATGTIQLGDVSVARPQVGDWFTNTLDSVIGVERWVIVTKSDPFQMDGYWKVTATFKKATFPAVNPTFNPL